jgi:HNH endonuclease
MRIPANHAGRRFGLWTALSPSAPTPRKWLCRCDCGTQKTLYINSLVRGQSKSCGCLHRLHPDEAFWSNVKKTDGCWVWTAKLDSHGYGMSATGARGARRYTGAHRQSWKLTFGDIPEGLCVLHRCDNPPCVNPGHLFLGTQGENIDDMHAKGRASGGSMKGERNPASKLTERQVAEIRALYVPRKITHRQLARDYGVSATAIQEVISRKKWAEAP